MSSSNLSVVLCFLEHKESDSGVISSGKELRLRGETIAKWKGKEVVLCKSKVGNRTSGLRNLIVELAASKNVKVIEQ